MSIWALTKALLTPLDVIVLGTFVVVLLCVKLLLLLLLNDFPVSISTSSVDMLCMSWGHFILDLACVV